MTRARECVLVFSCNDNLDVDETSFIEAISKELHKQEITPLTYNLLGRDNLDEELLCKSTVGIMILSNSVVSSRQSLDHLVAIMEHWKETNLVIIPIYFKVTLSDICGLKGRFEAVFLQLQRSLQEDRVQKWKAAMTELVSIGGLEWTKGSQLMLAEEVVRNASLRLYLKNSKHVVGILALLNKSQSSDVEIVGIWGMAGIGKTSIARDIYEMLAPHYDLCYFLQDFHLMCQMKGLRQLRDDFFSKVFGEEKLSIGACDTKLSFMKDMFHNKKILVVLDDVNNARDAEAVVGGFGWFSHGHTIILTSRRKQILVQCKVKELYQIPKLSEFESFRLCKQYLDRESTAVISELISCSSGIPLALKVLISSVSKLQNIKEHLQSLRKNPPTQIQEAFRRSFDGLDENEKNIFLDLACFFSGQNKDYVVQLLDACGFFTYLGIFDLVDESLISLLDNRIEIPIPFQDMGRFIVHEEDEDPCERSRLWDSNDITDVLINNSGTEAIEGIFLDASDLTCELSPTVFDKMYKLRLLKFYCSTSGNQCKLALPQGLDTLPDELTLLHWENYPLEYLPQKFNPENLVEINMPYSNMEKLWEGKKKLKKLRKIKLSHSKNLTDILTLSEAMNLEHIDLEGCMSLVDISTSVACCGKLVSLNLKDCSRLRSLPSMVGLTTLKLLNLSGCSELEDIQDLSPNLEELYLAGTAIRELPFSIENLTELVTLDLENCKRLQQLPIGISSLKSIVELKLPLNVENPADDGYKWRKYGQKQVKGSVFPRSYYRCTTIGCPVKKKVERSLDGKVTEIIYEGQHNHEPPQNTKRGNKDSTTNLYGSSINNNWGSSELAASQFQTSSSKKTKRKQHEAASQATTTEHMSEASDSEEVGSGETGVREKGESEPDTKRRSIEVQVSEPAAAEPKIIVRRPSEVDILDDGYKWRKYGQKVVKGNPYLRSYYKCTTVGCGVRKHVERSATDPKNVVTTYEGKHSHDLPLLNQAAMPRQRHS